MESFSDLCRPAQVYLVLAIIGLFPLIFAGKIISIILSIVFGIIFTLLLNWICSKGYPGVAWFITLLPFIGLGLGLILVTLTTISGASKANAANQPRQQQQQQQQQQ